MTIKSTLAITTVLGFGIILSGCASKLTQQDIFAYRKAQQIKCNQAEILLSNLRKPIAQRRYALSPTEHCDYFKATSFTQLENTNPHFEKGHSNV